MKEVQRQCRECLDLFYTTRTNQKFCCRECANSFHNRRKRREISEKLLNYKAYDRAAAKFIELLSAGDRDKQKRLVNQFRRIYHKELENN